MLSTTVRVFSDSVFCTAPSELDPIGACKSVQKKAEAGMKSGSLKKNRNAIAGKSIDIEWHVFPSETSVQTVQKLRAFMSGTWRGPEIFLDRIIFASMFNDITDWESRKVPSDMSTSNERSGDAARHRPGYLCFCGPGSEKTKKMD